jgi:hypothetical protein
MLTRHFVIHTVVPNEVEGWSTVSLTSTVSTVFVKPVQETYSMVTMLTVGTTDRPSIGDDVDADNTILGYRCWPYHHANSRRISPVGGRPEWNEKL